MTDLSVSGLRRTYRPDQTFGETVITGLGVPEAVITNAIGKLLTENPKYDREGSILNYWDQVHFSDLFEDAGLSTGKALGAGLVASFLFDPIGKIAAPFSLTKKGVALTKARAAAKLDKIENIEDVVQLSRGAVKGHLDDLVKKGAPKKQIREARKSLSSIDEANKILKDLQKEGMTREEIMSIPSVVEQLRNGERALFGFMKLRSMTNHLPFVRTRDFDTAINHTALSGKFGAPLAEAAQKMGRAVKDSTVNLINSITDKPSLLVREMHAAKEALPSILRAAEGDIAEFGIRARALMRETNLTPEQMRSVVDDLERSSDIPVGSLRAFRDILDQETPIDALRSRLAREVSQIETPQLRLSKSQNEMMSPPKLTEPEIFDAMNQWERAETPAVRLGKHQYRLTEDYVVLELGNEMATMSEKQLRKFINEKNTRGVGALPNWEVHTATTGERFLVARKIAGGMPISRRNVRTEHIENLGLAAAQLSRRGVPFEKLRREEILVSPFGGVQILDPFYAQAKAVKGGKTANSGAARETSIFSLLGLTEDLGAAPMPFPALMSNKASRIPDDALAYRWRHSHVNDRLTKDLQSVEVNFLLENAANGSEARQLIRSTARIPGETPAARAERIAGSIQEQFANRIQTIREQWALARIKNPADRPFGDPIEYFVDPNGEIWIRDGLDRLTAAALEGHTHVPLRRKPFIGEVADEGAPWYSSYGVPVKEALAYDVKLDKALINHVDKTKIADELDFQYRLLDKNGKAEKIGSIVADGADDLTDNFIRYITTSTKGSNATRDKMRSVLGGMMVEQYGSTPEAAIKIAGAVKRAETVADLYREFPESFFKALPFSPALVQSKQRGLAQLQRQADQFLDNLAQKGILTKQSGLARAELLSRTGRTVIQWDEADKMLNVVSATKSQRDLERLTKDVFSDIDVSNLHQFDQINLVGADGGRAIQVSDLVARPHPRIATKRARSTKLQLSKEVEETLRNTHNIYVNPTPEKLTELGVEKGGLLRGDKKLVYLMTKSGDLLIAPASPTVANVRGIQQAVLGEAADAFKVSEFGLVNRDHIIINNPFGGAAIEQLDRGSVKFLENRLREVAKKFKETGLRGSARFEVIAPFSQSVWDEIYRGGKRWPTLDDVAKDSFKLKVPKDLENVIVDTNVETMKGALNITRTQRQGNAQRVLNFLRENLEADLARELEANIDLHVISGYFPRYLTPQAKDAIDNAVRHNAKLAPYFGKSGNFKQRRFTDLTTNEINSLFRDADVSWTDIIKSAEAQSQAEAIRALRQAAGGDFDFFITEPLVAGFLRHSESVRARAELEVLDQLEEMTKGGVMFRGSIDEFNEFRNLDKSVADATKKYETIQGRIAATAEELDSLRASELSDPKLIEKAQKRLDGLKKALDKQDIELSKLHGKRKDAAGLLSGAVAADEANLWMRGAQARSLMEDGTLAADDIIGGYGDGVVQVKRDALPKLSGNKELFLMTPQTELLVSRLFDLQTNKFGATNKLIKAWDGFTNFWKQWTLFPIPAFHIRNTFSDYFLGYLGGVTNTDYNDSLRILNVLRRHHKGQLTYDEAFRALDDMELTSEVGTVVSTRELLQQFTRTGGFSGGLSFNEFTRFGRGQANMDRAMQQLERFGLKTASESTASNILVDNFLLRTGRNFQTGREAVMRFGAFLNKWKSTGDFQEAGNFMKAVFYDYSDLTHIERNFVRRVVPFYSWLRFNIPRQIETLVTQPILHARIQGMIHNIRTTYIDSPIDEENLPEFMKEREGLVIAKRGGQYVVVSPEGLLPMIDLAVLMNNMGSVGDIKDFAVSQLHPGLKYPIEQFVNMSFFSGRRFEEFGGQLARSGTLASMGMTRRATTEGPLSFINLIWNESAVKDFFRLGKQASQWVDYMADSSNFRGESPSGPKSVRGVQLLIETFLTRLYDVDPKAAAKLIERKQSQIENNLKWAYNRAKREGNAAAANQAKLMLNRIRLYGHKED